MKGREWYELWCQRKILLLQYTSVGSHDDLNEIPPWSNSNQITTFIIVIHMILTMSYYAPMDSHYDSIEPRYIPWAFNLTLILWNSLIYTILKP